MICGCWAASTHQTPGQLGQGKTDAAVMEVSSPARERADPEAQKDTGLKSSSRCKRKVCVLPGDISPGDGKYFYFFLILPPPACAGKNFTPRWQIFSATFCSQDFNQPENTASLCFLSTASLCFLSTASLCFLSLLMVNAL